MKAERVHAPVRQSAIFAAYYAVLVVFLAASFFPEYRIWGVNWWAYFPGYVPFVLFAIGAVAPIVMQLVLRRGESDVSDKQVSTDKSGKYFIIVFCLTVLYALAFYLLRAKTHFLGDGYTVLSLLAADTPLRISRELGEALAHIWVKSAIGGDAEAAALLSFQVISISAGVLLLMAVAVFAGMLFERTRDRILFLLGLASSGYMLLFFGYVENYSLFVLSVAVYSLMGLLVVKGRINRWLMLPIVALPIFFHVLGVTLIPSAIYLLVTNSKLGNTLAGLNRKTKLLMGAITAAILVSLFYHYYSTEYILRLAVVPLIQNRLTVEGYTLFSTKHLVDYFNLLVLLLPCPPLVATTLLLSPMRKVFKQREYRYLLILVLSTLGAVFIFDPKLGMPRDWDLFSFSGVPLAILSYYLLLNIRSKGRLGSQIVFLAVLLGFLSLLPRASSQAVEDISVTHLIGYIDLDKARNRTTRTVLINYYGKLDKHDQAVHLKQRWRRELLEDNMLPQAAGLIDQNKIQQAISLLNRFMDLNSAAPGAWQKLGQCYFTLGKYDSALLFLNISNGMNPYNSNTLYYIGLTHYEKKEYKKAEEFFSRALDIDSLHSLALNGLAHVYIELKDQARYTEVLLRLASLDDASLEFLQRVAGHYLRKGEYQLAAEAYQRALQKGLDSMYVKQRMEKYPELSKQFHLQVPPRDSSESQR